MVRAKETAQRVMGPGREWLAMGHQKEMDSVTEKGKAEKESEEKQQSFLTDRRCFPFYASTITTIFSDKVARLLLVHITHISLESRFDILSSEF
jgi:hypothetical protein